MERKDGGEEGRGRREEEGGGGREVCNRGRDGEKSGFPKNLIFPGKQIDRQITHFRLTSNPSHLTPLTPLTPLSPSLPLSLEWLTV